MKYYIITGTSRGLGESLAKQLIQPGHTVFCISRSGNADLKALALERQAFLHDIRFDLQELHEIPSMMTGVMNDIDSRDAEMLVLINNAAVLDPITRAGYYSPDDLSASIQVNLTAPMLLSSLFLQQSSQRPGEKRIVNITSGAAQHPYFGWGAYCSTKAGLEMFTRCVGLEQQEQQHPTLIVAVAPGVVDTDMQSQIRQANSDDFPQVDRFLDMYEHGKLASPDAAAEKLITFFHRDDLMNGNTYDVRALE